MNHFKFYVQELENFSKEVENHSRVDREMFYKFEKINSNLFDELLQIELNLKSSGLKELQKKFRKETDFIYERSDLAKRARKWLRGYAGDFVTLEALYQGAPISMKGIGLYIEIYHSTRQLALGVRARKDKLREILIEELYSRPRRQKVLNIACGSCRELYEISDVIIENEPEIICTDSDNNALVFAHNLLFTKNIKMMPQFMVHNALKLVSSESNKITFGKQDIIYSAGLFDYLKDEVLIRILDSLFNLLNNNGILIAPFKDSRFYNRLDYHWITDWSAFYQRNTQEIMSLFRNIGSDKVTIMECSSPAIKFFIVRKN